ncbi:uncharacterized protein LOC121857092 isoform X4 [Homarus americanus]|uniref:uncharacterized protein LOC121857092 isoform X4 n=1 Tax=Homarus americanus TaxID=6706 RepID=UPI001C44F7A3|nr:uncharacterized protein LOC121857092 isoform X4 [Homarus americanus]
MGTPQQPPGSSSQQTTTAFDEEETCSLRLIKMTDRSGQPAMLTVYKLSAQKAGKPNYMKLSEFLKNKKQFTDELLEYKFDTIQREKIEGDPDGKSYDISLLFQAIALVRGSVSLGAKLKFMDLHDDLHEKLQAVKNFRNNLMHSRLGVSNNHFVEKTEELRTLLTELLEAAKAVYDIDDRDFDQMVRNMNDQLNDTRDKPLTDDDITRYSAPHIFTYLENLLLTSGKPELLEMLKRRRHLSPMSFIEDIEFSLDVDNVFTHIRMKESGPLTLDRDIRYEQILELVHNVDESFTNVARIILIEGPAGVGKTTFLLKLLSDWQDGKNTIVGLTDYQLLFYTECRNPHISSLKQLLQSQMPNTAKKYRGEDMVKYVQELRLLVLVDGLDELNEASRKLFSEILSMKATCNATIVCTTRPEMVDDFCKTIPKHMKPVFLELVGISDNSRTEFAAKYHDELVKVNKSTQSTQELKEYLQSVPSNIQEHLRLPLNLIFFTFIWATDPTIVNNMTTATQLYIKIQEMTTEKLIERLKCNADTQHLPVKDLERKTQIFFRKLCRESLVSLKDDSIILTQGVTDNLKQTSDTVGLPLEEVIGAFLIQTNTWSTLGTRSYLSFPHKGVQDFYSALYIRDTLQGNNVNFDVCKMVHDVQDSVSSYQIPSSLSQDIMEEFSNILSERLTLKGTCTIKKVLEEIHKDDPSSLTLRKYQNVLIHLAGVLCTEGKMETEDTAEELVVLLKDAGVKSESQWLELINGVKCNATLCKYIAEHITSLVTGDIRIRDNSVSAFTALLPHARPDNIIVRIKGNQNNIPHFDDMMKMLAACNNCDIHIYLDHNFRHPETSSPSLDAALQLVFKRCRVRQFKGQLSGAAVKMLPDTLLGLHLVITGKDPDLAPALSSLWRSVRLGLHVPAGVTPALLPRQLPNIICGLDLFLSGIDTDHIDWAAQVAQQLQPENMQLGYLVLPGSHLSDQDLQVLANQLKRLDVLVGDGVYVTGDKHQAFALSGYTVHRMKKEDIWRWGERKGEADFALRIQREQEAAEQRRREQEAAKQRRREQEAAEQRRRDRDEVVQIVSLLGSLLQDPDVVNREYDLIENQCSIS